MPHVAVIYGDLVAETETEELQFLRRRLYEDEDKLGRAQHAAAALDRGLPEGTVRFEHADVLAVIQAVDGIKATERRLLSGLVALSNSLRDEMDNQLGGEFGRDVH